MLVTPVAMEIRVHTEMGSLVFNGWEEETGVIEAGNIHLKNKLLKSDRKVTGVWHTPIFQSVTSG